MNTTMVSQSEKPRSNFWISGLIGGGLGFFGSLALLVLAGLLGIPLLVASGPPVQSPLLPLGVGQIFVAILIPALGATLFYALLRRVFNERADWIFQVVALAALLFSLGGPLSLPISAANKLILVLMHLVTGSAIIWALSLRK
jgi:hypothetical protein